MGMKPLIRKTDGRWHTLRPSSYQSWPGTVNNRYFLFFLPLSNSISPIFFPSVLFSLIAHTDSVISGPWCALRHIIIMPQCESHLYRTKEQDGAISFSIVTKVNCCRRYSQWLRRCKTDTSADLVQTIWWLLLQTMVWLDGGWWWPFGRAQGISF